MKSRYFAIALSLGAVLAALLIYLAVHGRKPGLTSSSAPSTNPATTSGFVADPSASTVTPELVEAYNKACAMAQSDPHVEQLGHYQAFIDKYPTSPLTPKMMSKLAMCYARRGKMEEATLLLDAANDLLGKDPFTNTIDINRAHVCFLQGEMDRGRKILQGVVARTADDAFVFSGTSGTAAFVAPMTLAESYARDGKPKEAEELLTGVTDRATRLLKQHPNLDWITTYAGEAYTKRVTLRLQSKPPDHAAARKLLEEMKRHMPQYYGAGGFDRIIDRAKLAEETAKTGQRNVNP
jgi:tetratricopeptide (TPR) repeat protein